MKIPGACAHIASLKTVAPAKRRVPLPEDTHHRSRGASGEWVPVPYVDPSSAEQLFRHKVIRLLQREGLLDEDRTRLLLSWHHSGFSVHNLVIVPAGDGGALEALARYCLRHPVQFPLRPYRWALAVARRAESVGRRASPVQ
jgi:hypothetical protein